MVKLPLRLSDAYTPILLEACVEACGKDNRPRPWPATGPLISVRGSEPSSRSHSRDYTCPPRRILSRATGSKGVDNAAGLASPSLARLASLTCARNANDPRSRAERCQDQVPPRLCRSNSRLRIPHLMPTNGRDSKKGTTAHESFFERLQEQTSPPSVRHARAQDTTRKPSPCT